MKLQTVSKIILLLILIAGKVNAQVVMTDPAQTLAIKIYGDSINSALGQQYVVMQEIAARQGMIAASFSKIAGWERKYNSYLKKAQGFAQSIAAGVNIYAEGVMTLRNLYYLSRAIETNPEGIGATLSMNNLYADAAAQIVKTFYTLKTAIKQGGKNNMLDGAQRNTLLWAVQDDLAEMNRSLRQLSMSIAYYNFSDVWKNLTSGMIDKTHGEIAEEALSRWKRSVKIQEIFK